jgi:hypothetical protein
MTLLQRQPIDQSLGSVKKAYNRPQLVIYGQLRDITNTNSCNGNSDGLTGHCGNNPPTYDNGVARTGPR